MFKFYKHKHYMHLTESIWFEVTRYARDHKGIFWIEVLIRGTCYGLFFNFSRPSLSDPNILNPIKIQYKTTEKITWEEIENKEKVKNTGITWER